MSSVTMEATTMLPILKKKLAFLSGGKDRRSGLILTIPLSSDQTSMEELSTTLDYLLSIPRYAQGHAGSLCLCGSSVSSCPLRGLEDDSSSLRLSRPEPQSLMRR
ncbi:SEC14 domain and spectrin repeat-containing protein 1-B [Liparis tanakae]|uniref:SEC14 domain and spectrin repeat-containing protein 1-B n=1 Tax=Liparis tanakae TaxID=230148 RepID=A0A4Z2E9Q8_9TELE|nr:SEC14 domain and spectrin repeat-containing protein 1-B [Liparis tanakae]